MKRDLERDNMHKQSLLKDILYKLLSKKEMYLKEEDKEKPVSTEEELLELEPLEHELHVETTRVVESVKEEEEEEVE